MITPIIIMIRHQKNGTFKAVHVNNLRYANINKKSDYNECTEEEEEEFPEQNTVRKLTPQRRQPYRRTKRFNFKKVDIHRSLRDIEESSGETTELDQEESIVFMAFSKELKSPEIVPSQLGGTNKQEPEQLEDRTMVQIQPQDVHEEALPHNAFEAIDPSMEVDDEEVVLHEEPLAPLQHTNQTAKVEVPDITQHSASEGKTLTKKYKLRPRPYARTDHSWNNYKGTVYWKIKTPQPGLWLKTHLMKLTTSKMMHL